ncbi:MAG: hypothetical protein M1829_000097 [Trizodia sp. TS-e1964]|nr:MAG: hypothetical protein M1829_000097 [Trizodia sp. TS-e1964]
MMKSVIIGLLTFILFGGLSQGAALRQPGADTPPRSADSPTSANGDPIAPGPAVVVPTLDDSTPSTSGRRTPPRPNPGLDSQSPESPQSQISGGDSSGPGIPPSRSLAGTLDGSTTARSGASIRVASGNRQLAVPNTPASSISQGFAATSPNNNEPLTLAECSRRVPCDGRAFSLDKSDTSVCPTVVIEPSRRRTTFLVGLGPTHGGASPPCGLGIQFMVKGVAGISNGIVAGPCKECVGENANGIAIEAGYEQGHGLQAGETPYDVYWYSLIDAPAGSQSPRAGGSSLGRPQVNVAVAGTRQGGGIGAGSRLPGADATTGNTVAGAGLTPNPRARPTRNSGDGSTRLGGTTERVNAIGPPTNAGGDGTDGSDPTAGGDGVSRLGASAGAIAGASTPPRRQGGSSGLGIGLGAEASNSLQGQGGASGRRTSPGAGDPSGLTQNTPPFPGAGAESPSPGSRSPLIPTTQAAASPRSQGGRLGGDASTLAGTNRRSSSLALGGGSSLGTTQVRGPGNGSPSKIATAASYANPRRGSKPLSALARRRIRNTISLHRQKYDKIRSS